MTTAFPHPMRLPVISAPMFLVSGPELVIAACKAGIGGAFPTSNCRTIADLDAWMGQITDALNPGDGPWVANLITHSTNARLEEDLRLVAQYKPPIVITALGSPKPVMETVKGYGGLVFADVVNMAKFHSRLVVTAAYMKPVEVPFSTMLTSEMTITTAVGYPTEMPEVIAAMPRLKDKIASLISHRVPFDAVLDGLKIAAQPDSAKVMVHFDEAGA